MSACEQTKGMSVLEHGKLVNDYYHDLSNHLHTGSNLKFKWRIPDWIYQYKWTILNNMYDSYTMDQYQIYHDCGKPYCKTVDENGKQHFPDHANVSYQVWSQVFPHERPVIGELIKSDMDVHLLKADGVEAFAERPEAISLLLTGLSEIHANATMFGGNDSTSFKIKWKQIDKRGKHIVEKTRVDFNKRMQSK